MKKFSIKINDKMSDKEISSYINEIREKFSKSEKPEQQTLDDLRELFGVEIKTTDSDTGIILTANDKKDI